MNEMPEWEKRFRAPRVGLPDWAEDAPDRSLFVSNATGTYELYAWDRATGGSAALIVMLVVPSVLYWKTCSPFASLTECTRYFAGTPVAPPVPGTSSYVKATVIPPVGVPSPATVPSFCVMLVIRLLVPSYPYVVMKTVVEVASSGLRKLLTFHSRPSLKYS